MVRPPCTIHLFRSFLTSVVSGTFYGTGLGSCGITNSDTDFIVAISHIIYDAFPGYTSGNPNNNPACGRKIRATYQGKSVEVTAVDRCVGCAEFDLDFSPSAFDQLADPSIGRLHGVQWQWIS
ncbi:barwin-like endoglucanase [Dichomitus squalens]|uniref:barwin-like endoglucanase n=1 Tax=Dichomitus squalens (strain LYAD-421) TaxID=732165 RepID=UPI0004415978|nr:barwin-like endoglucanase [Dichomitus squalens LYAD-421 SS1]EJF67025.1 barwin-like endoglucanase [Dichomitus squalens LYAD-421 SS1]TBU48174.1 barwin-like endoglucanase [Dichomitus squalens]